MAVTTSYQRLAPNRLLRIRESITIGVLDRVKASSATGVVLARAVARARNQVQAAVERASKEGHASP